MPKKEKPAGIKKANKKPAAQKPPKKKKTPKTISNPVELQKAKKIQAKIEREKMESELKVEGKLSIKQERFCKLYATDQEFFGNGVQSYIEAYDVDMSKPNWYKSAQSSASRLLSKAMIFNRINSLLEKTGFTDVAVDKQISFLIHQQADFTNKLGAIREYNKIKNRYPTQKVEHSGSIDLIEITNYGTEDENEN